MIEFNVEQGTPEWIQSRCGKITASMFGEACKKLKSGANKGKPTAAALDYAFRLAGERATGLVIDDGQFTTWAMKRGNELEGEARLRHEDTIDRFIRQTGFVCTDDERFGASADGLIGDDGGSEYKCLVNPGRLRMVIDELNVDDFMHQVQGCMWITGRQWWHLCIYVPAFAPAGRDLTILEVERDEAFIEEMVAGLEEFDQLVENYRATFTPEHNKVIKIGAQHGE